MEQEKQPKQLKDVINLDTPVSAMTMADIQNEIGQWAEYNFGRTGNQLFEQEQLSKMLMIFLHAGDAAHALLKSTQNIRASNEEHRRAWNEAIEGLSTVNTLLGESEVREFMMRLPDEFTIAPLLGVVEEVGELTSAVLSGDKEETEDAVGDMLVFLLHLCAVNGIDADGVLVSTWGKVRTRDWRKNKENGQ